MVGEPQNLGQYPDFFLSRTVAKGGQIILSTPTHALIKFICMIENQVIPQAQ